MITERDKMLRGELYIASDPELAAARERARRLWRSYNALDPAAVEVFLDCNAIDIGAQTQIGPAVQLYTATHRLGAAARTAGPELAHPIRIGSRVWIGGGSCSIGSFYSSSYKYLYMSRIQVLV
jgi:maltose O-acetyltransferase